MDSLTNCIVLFVFRFHLISIIWSVWHANTCTLLHGAVTIVSTSRFGSITEICQDSISLPEIYLSASRFGSISLWRSVKTAFLSQKSVNCESERQHFLAEVCQVQRLAVFPWGDLSKKKPSFDVLNTDRLISEVGYQTGSCSSSIHHESSWW